MAQPQGTKITTDHDIIKTWVKTRGGKPAAAKEGRDVPEIISIRFHGNRSQRGRLKPVSWKEFFKDFDEEELALMFQDKTVDGETSTYFKFINR